MQPDGASEADAACVAPCDEAYVLSAAAAFYVLFVGGGSLRNNDAPPPPLWFRFFALSMDHASDWTRSLLFRNPRDGN